MHTVRPYLDRLPQLGQRVYIDEAARVVGDVVLGDDVSVWPFTVIRGDVNFVASRRHHRRPGRPDT